MMKVLHLLMGFNLLSLLSVHSNLRTMSTESTLLPIVTSSTLSTRGILSFLVLRNLVNSVLFQLRAVGPYSLWYLHHLSHQL